jgi:hypothetical protein
MPLAVIMPATWYSLYLECLSLAPALNTSDTVMKEVFDSQINHTSHTEFCMTVSYSIKNFFNAMCAFNLIQSFHGIYFLVLLLLLSW